MRVSAAVISYYMSHGWRHLCNRSTASEARAELSERSKEHGLPTETEASIKAKLRRGTFTATFLLATLAVLEVEGMRLEDL